ncbi:PREDICTED: uncharacterized protein LOC107189807 [Dufourea novaeangliae]|uniref:Uncharacterized protein n=1 Tax=Dufourea novaeangliae TaxID=178035 RepID=A0A154NZT6_DUFNO|nr:PREDICTED: uncharacterized protein LOC107189807 [Dufourea novaeangliae]KZC04508.1 hypothetical protein WN55_00583 [Dufourea novaeangliae]
MSKITSATGLMDARIRLVQRPETKRVELSGSAKPAPFILRPFSGLFNPYPYGCSVLCNHPADCEAKDVLRRAKNSWATEGKALLLPEEMDMIRASVAAAAGTMDAFGHAENLEMINVDPTTVPEELFRKYTETDSRPLTPAPTLASGPALTNRPQEEFLTTCNPQERTTLILDLRANSKKQTENETFTWHALTLEPPPTSRKTNITIPKSPLRHRSRSPNPSTNVSALSACEDAHEPSSSRDIEEENSGRINKDFVIIRRRGKRLRKGKNRSGSTYRQHTEVHDLLEPTETQISHIGDGSRRTSIHTSNGDTENPSLTPKKATALTKVPSIMSTSFIEIDILKHLLRELDRDKIEAEFSLKRRLAFEEALRIKGESYSRGRGYHTPSNPKIENTPRVFSRKVVRFEILGSESLLGLTVLDYIGKHVFVSSGRKLIFGRIFNKFQEETLRTITRYISSTDIREALEEVIGKLITAEQEVYLKSMIGEINESLNFRSWCGLCATVERLLCPLPHKEIDPPSWLERVDFEALERRLKSVDVNPQLAIFLREIRDK